MSKREVHNSIPVLKTKIFAVSKVKCITLFSSDFIHNYYWFLAWDPCVELPEAAKVFSPKHHLQILLLTASTFGCPSISPLISLPYLSFSSSVPSCSKSKLSGKAIVSFRPLFL